MKKNYLLVLLYFIFCQNSFSMVNIYCNKSSYSDSFKLDFLETKNEFFATSIVISPVEFKNIVLQSIKVKNPKEGFSYYLGKQGDDGFLIGFPDVVIQNSFFQNEKNEKITNFPFQIEIVRLSYTLKLVYDKNATVSCFVER